MSTSGKMRIKRRAKSIPETAQMQLLEPGPVVSKPDREVDYDDDFINPSPQIIFFGDQRLRDYLIDCGLEWVIRLRELLEESDFSEFKAGYRSTGRKAIHPVVVLGLIIYGIIEGKSSLRQLESLASRDLGAMWLCGGLRPDHSTIGKFINRFSGVLTEKYFIELTRMLLSKLSMQSGDVAGDGTIIEAASSRYKLIRLEAAREAAERAQSEAQKAKEVAQIAEERAAKIKNIGRDPGKMKLSPVEPEAVNQKMKNGSRRPSYKPSVFANEFRMIVGQSVEPSDENASVGPMLDQYESIHRSKPSCAIFDGGYHNYTVLRLALELELNVLCPSGCADGGEWDKRSTKGRYGKKQFRYDEQRDIYICPEGRELYRYGSVLKKRGQNCVCYRCKECDQCKRRAECTTDKKGRSISRFEVDAMKEAMVMVFENVRARKAYSRRKAMVEPVFSRLRTDQNLNRFHRYGLGKVRVEFSLHCIAYNLKRAIRLEAVGVFCLIFMRNRGEIRLVKMAEWLVIVLVRN